MDRGVRALQLESGNRLQRQPSGPRVSKTAQQWPLTRPLRLIAIEETHFGHARARPHTQDGNRAFENLGQVMVYWIAENRPRHWVVGPERSEPLSGHQRHPGGAIDASQGIVEGGDQLVDVGMGMPAVDEPFTPVAGGELTLRDGEPLQVECAQHPQAIGGGTGVDHDRGLDQPHFAERAIARDRIDRGVGEDAVGPEPDPGGGLRREILREACPERSEWAQDDSRAQDDRRYPDESQSDSATAPRPAESPARMKSRFIRVIVSMLICLGHASWHSPYRVHPPKCSMSIRATMPSARR
jgi:hypothetical protein